MTKEFKSCYKCEDRYPGCHSNCSRYWEGVEKRKKIKENRKREKARRLDTFDRLKYWK